MITNDNELRITRERLSLAEAALESLRRDVMPRNEVQYRLFSGTTIDLIRSIRADINDYLGIGTDTDLALSLEGDLVSLGITSAAIITRTIDTFRRGLQSVASILYADNQNGAVNKRARHIERLCDLSLVGIEPGSVKVYLDLPTMGGGMFSEEDRHLLTDAIATLFDGLEWAARDDGVLPQSLEHLSPSTRLSVLGVVARLLPPQTGPVERIVYRRRGEGRAMPSRQATLTRKSHPRVQEEMERLATDRKFTTANGVIRQIDLDAQTFVLRERPDSQSDLPCEYPSVLTELVKELLDCQVKVSGLLETSRLTLHTKMEAEAIEPLGGDEEAAEQGEHASQKRQRRIRI